MVLLQEGWWGGEGHLKAPLALSAAKRTSAVEGKLHLGLFRCQFLLHLQHQH